ncbi:MAG TPA: nucleotide pyrophosphatase/phosphodiesterase family protein [Tepidisphaeraceae bacterium]|nr:nucleotide pyrophosphatase/phosphodiesterase family protein [Tepidisphaeraceae bacterium]
MHKTVVINAVGLTARLVGGNTPRIGEIVRGGEMACVGTVWPAVTTTVQSTYLTGTWPSEHGIVGNGWYFRDQCEVKFWRQSNKLVQGGKIWERARERDAKFSCANLFWWYNMYCGADWSVTPRPMYPADGRKIPDVYSSPAGLREELQGDLGQFPLFEFWGPMTSIRSTEWIAEAAIRVDRKFDPTLSLIYLPHLDYGLQRWGPDDARIAGELRDLDGVVGKLVDHFRSRGARVLILSEYGIQGVSRQIHLNRVLREAGLLAVREEMGRELLDAGASVAFAVADHQVAHVYVNDKSRVGEVRDLAASVKGVARVLDERGKEEMHLDHERSGELVALAERDAWFTYYYWLDEARRPDFARTVDIHRKPGYDPAELFLDSNILSPKMKVAWTLLKRKMGMRSLLEVIPTDGGMVKGSHGVEPATPEEGAVIISSEKRVIGPSTIEGREVYNVIWRSVFEGI